MSDIINTTFNHLPERTWNVAFKDFTSQTFTYTSDEIDGCTDLWRASLIQEVFLCNAPVILLNDEIHRPSDRLVPAPRLLVYCMVALRSHDLRILSLGARYQIFQKAKWSHEWFEALEKQKCRTPFFDQGMQPAVSI